MFTDLFSIFFIVPSQPNVQLYCLLREIEKELHARLDPNNPLYNKPFPHTLFYQSDGAKDNVCETTLALCEWLVLKGIFCKIIFTRLPVGHTHDDVDAFFGCIWKVHIIYLFLLLLHTPF